MEDYFRLMGEYFSAEARTLRANSSGPRTTGDVERASDLIIGWTKLVTEVAGQA